MKITLKKDVFLLFFRGLWLILRRPSGGLWGDLWEFPVLEAGHFDTWKDREAAIGRELGVEVTLEHWEGKVGHTLTHRQMEYRVFRGVVVEGELPVRVPSGGIESAAKVSAKCMRVPAKGSGLGGGYGAELPICAEGGAGGEGRYEEAAWVKMGDLGKLYAVGKVTLKIAVKAEG